jgi:hypothetical protein
VWVHDFNRGGHVHSLAGRVVAAAVAVAVVVMWLQWWSSSHAGVLPVLFSREQTVGRLGGWSVSLSTLTDS